MLEDKLDKKEEIVTTIEQLMEQTNSVLHFMACLMGNSTVTVEDTTYYLKKEDKKWLKRTYYIIQ